MRKSTLPIHDDIKTLTYYRNPTQGEVKFGYGAIHYADFSKEECCFEKDGKFYPKAWFVSKYDGLRYYR